MSISTIFVFPLHCHSCEFVSCHDVRVAAAKGSYRLHEWAISTDQNLFHTEQLVVYPTVELWRILQ